MQPKVVVFLGPSLPRDRAEEILNAEYMPPAKRGDIYRAVEDAADIIGLIDGVFFQDSAVAHKEILHALKNDVVVVGASSMGALRASELDIYGMEGVGEIYRLYKRGELVSDDEVALVFDPISFEPLSEPLINIRYSIETAEKSGIINKVTGDLILEAARSLYFPERTYERIMDAAEGLDDDIQKGFRDFMNMDKKDLKMEDAISALKRIKEISQR
jgi:hypothetical protein